MFSGLTKSMPADYACSVGLNETDNRILQRLCFLWSQSASDFACLFRLYFHVDAYSCLWNVCETSVFSFRKFSPI